MAKHPDDLVTIHSPKLIEKLVVGGCSVGSTSESPLRSPAPGELHPGGACSSTAYSVTLPRRKDEKMMTEVHS